MSNRGTQRRVFLVIRATKLKLFISPSKNRTHNRRTQTHDGPLHRDGIKGNETKNIYVYKEFEKIFNFNIMF